MKRRFLLISLVVLLFSCSKESNNNPVTPPPPADPNADPAAYGTPFSGVASTEDIVMYEVNERAFSVAGDFNGVKQRLDNIKALGVNTIWLMPIHPVGKLKSVNSLYCVADYKGVNPEFGTLSDLRALVDAAHAKNMSVILDWVANHTAWDNPWVTANKSWYMQDASGNITYPYNWTDVAELNFSNADMRLAMIKAMKYWVLTANVDGFRFDAADEVPDDFWVQSLDTLKSMPGRNLVLLAEGSHASHFTSGFQMNFANGFYDYIVKVFGATAGNPSMLYTMNTQEYAGVTAGKKRLRFTTNHDRSAWEKTPMQLFGKDGALAAAVVTAYMNGVPLIYGSQEVGRVANVPFFSKSPIDWTANPDMETAYQKIFAFYNASDPLRKGTLTTYADADVVCFKKTAAGKEVIVIANARNSAVNFSLPAALQGTGWTDAFDNTTLNLTTSIALSPYQYLVLKN